MWDPTKAGLSVLAAMMAGMSREHDHERSKQIKRHALLRDIVLEHPLWAGNDADWALIMENRYSVICERQGYL